ncbi:hypothetical protein Slin14017_G000430 [Septoria linicola]|nr:hypothetical protein Slin14017_G000430 [Septoria linicola]
MAPIGGPWFSSSEKYAETYHLAELRDLAVTRSTAIPVDGMDKDSCIALLIELEQREGKWTGPSQFLELAGEITVIRPSYKPVTMSVAKALVYSTASTLESILIKCTNEYVFTRKSLTPRGEDVIHASSSPDEATHYFDWEIEPQFPKFENGSVSLELNLGNYGRANSTTAEELCITARQCLYHLASKLMASARLKKVVLNIKLTGFSDAYADAAFRAPDDGLMQQALWPVTLIGASPVVTITRVSAVVQEHIKANMRDMSLPAQDKQLISTSVSLLRECDDLQMRMRVLDHEGLRACSVLDYRLRDLVIYDKTWVNAEYIQAVAQSVSEIQAFFGTPAIRQLNTKWGEWNRQRHTRSEKKAPVKALLL